LKYGRKPSAWFTGRIQCFTAVSAPYSSSWEAVKRQLDYQVALQNARKDFERTNMIHWITSEVRKSITPKQEQEALQACLNRLRQMASTSS
jgi:HAMP domain-containing protein